VEINYSKQKSYEKLKKGIDYKNNRWYDDRELTKVYHQILGEGGEHTDE